MASGRGDYHGVEVAGWMRHSGGVQAGRNSVPPYFACEECSVEAARVEEAGGKIHKRKFSIGQYGFIALVTDTEGNMIGLHSVV